MLLKVIKDLLLKIVSDIDKGSSEITTEEAIEVIDLLKTYTNKSIPMSKYQAYTYLNISRASFDNLVKDGLLPKGKKVAGFKELQWFKEDLNKYINSKKDEKES